MNSTSIEAASSSKSRNKGSTKMEKFRATLQISKYHYQKSLCQIDLKLARRIGLLQFKTQSEKGSFLVISRKFVERLAGMRVQNIFLLNAWRKRRGEVKTLKAEVGELRKCNIKSKTQIDILNSLFNIEKKSTAEVSQQLRSTCEQNRELLETLNEIKGSVARIGSKWNAAKQELIIKTRDYQALNVFFKQTKTELLGVMSELQETKNQLNVEQFRLREIEEEKRQVIIERENAQILLRAKESELSSLQAEVETLKMDLKNTKDILGTQVDSEVKLKAELESYINEVQFLRGCLAATVGQRVENCWKKFLEAQRATFHLAHSLAAGLLPGLPPPKQPFSFSLKMDLNIFKRNK